MTSQKTQIKSQNGGKPRTCGSALVQALIFAFCLLHATLGLAQDAASFEADLRALTQHPHRLSGTPQAHDAAAHIQTRLQAMGVETFPLDMPVWQTRTERCELTIDGRTVPLLPLRPNLIVPPTTGPQGLTGPIRYVGKGELSAYGRQDPRGAIVVLDYESDDNWERAFSLGAKAVIFLGDPQAAPVQNRHAAVPANLVRLYAPPQVQAQIDLRRDWPQATVVSHVQWESSWGRNLLAYLPGANPTIEGGLGRPELLVLGAHYDSFGVVPEDAPGARGAANVAALLQSVAYLKDHRPQRDVVVMFLDNQARYHQGARYVYDALNMKKADVTRLLKEHQEEHKTLAQVAELLRGTDLQAMGSHEAPPAAWYTRLWHLVAGIATVSVLVVLVVFLWRRNWMLGAAGLVLATTALALGSWALLTLGRPATQIESDVLNRLRGALVKEAEFIRADINQELLETRLARGAGRAEDDTRAQARIADLRQRVLDWDNTRRWLDRRRFERIHPQRGQELSQATLARIEGRLAELDLQMRIATQRQALWEKLANRWVVLHVTYDFADQGPTWGLVVSEWTERSYWGVRPQGDSPGYYGRVLGAFREAAVALPAESGLALATLSDTSIASRYVPGQYVAGGMIAGTYGTYNVSLMTSFDGRPRDGHPADTLEHLDWRRILRQAYWADRLMKSVADSSAISLYRVFDTLALTKRPAWSSGRSTGDYVGLQVTGSLSEDRPASGALMALAPNPGTVDAGNWNFLLRPGRFQNFDPLLMEAVDGNGRFPIVSVRKGLFNAVMGLGALYDEQGNVRAVTTQDTLRRGNVTAALRFNLFPARPGVVVSRQIDEPLPGTLKVLSAATNAAFQKSRSLFGQQGNHNFLYASALIPPPGIKVFQDKGPVLLNVQSERDPYGQGLSINDLVYPPAIDSFAARDLWLLNEGRLQALRQRGVTDADLEALHSRAGQALERAQETEQIDQRQAYLKQSVSLSRAMYSPLRQSMDDLVHAIVVLLLLAIPFAFALERLLFAATTIYRRLAGFAVTFIVTFLLLFFMHPGFAIASTPIIIFLAFTILLLSSLVIFIITRKFRTELKAMQGQGVGLHHLEVSRLGTLLAAVNMGMSTMRRRPTRTTLTAVTVVMLTFTILCFAAVTNRVGVRSIGQGPINEDVAASMQVRHLNYKALPAEKLTLLAGVEGQGGFLAGQWWLVRANANDDPFSIARPDDGTALWLDGMLGLTPEELRRWPELAATLGQGSVEDKIRSLAGDGVYLPAIVQERLGLKVGDRVLYHGQQATFAGVIDATNLQRLAQLDGRPVLPVDLLDASQAMAESNLGTQATDVEEMVERDFVYLSPDQVAIASAWLVRRLGGDLRAINVYPGGEVDSLAQGREIAQMVAVPVWARGPVGVERMIFTRLTQVTGGLALVVPVVLGGLIIFGTLLGSISDREKEIYTFSALGLAPKHVGFLFFAEASVYAVVGGMVGQILAQAVALIAPHVARWLDMGTPSINYSSTNSLFAIGLVMATVLISAIYPALRASKSANPGLARSWRMPRPEGDELAMTFPFTVSAYDITGVVSFLAEHFRAHNDAGLGNFAAQDVHITRQPDTGNLQLAAHLALAPFDLGVTQDFSLTARPSEIQGVDEVAIRVHRASGANGDWYRANRVFIQDLRRQFLLWRTLSAEMIEQYRLETLQVLGENGQAAAAAQAAAGENPGQTHARTPLPEEGGH